MGKKDAPYLCQKDNLALIGTADPTRQMAPYDNPAWEIWGVAVAITYPDVTRMDVHFEMHTKAYWDRDPNVKARLVATKVPIYMHARYKDIPTSMRYPIEAITAYRKYHTSTISYMEALAYHSFVLTGKPKAVGLWGIHMSAEEEYKDQRPACEYWIGRMEAAGMKVTLSEGGDLFVAPGLYGYEKYNPVCWEMRQRAFGIAAGITQANGELDRWKIQKAKNEGAQYECEFWLRKFQRGEL